MFSYGFPLGLGAVLAVAVTGSTAKNDPSAQRAGGQQGTCSYPS